jgi:hypothetical protein
MVRGCFGGRLTPLTTPLPCFVDYCVMIRARCVSAAQEAQLAARRKQYKSPPTQALKERVRESCRTRIHAQRDDIFARCRAQRAMTASMLRSVILDVVDAECRMEDARAAGGDVDDGPPEFTEEGAQQLLQIVLRACACGVCADGARCDAARVAAVVCFQTSRNCRRCCWTTCTTRCTRTRLSWRTSYALQWS